LNGFSFAMSFTSLLPAALADSKQVRAAQA